MRPEDPPIRAEVQRGDQDSRHTKKAAIVLGMVLACCPCVFALNPYFDVSQYSHTRWDVSKGFSTGVIRAIAQTLDGYLWVGTDFGLFRFDGVRAVPWEPPAGEHIPGGQVTRLFAGRDGALWIGTLRGLASWTAGKLKRYPELEGQRIEALLEDREGTIWVGGWAASAGTLCSIKGGSAQCYGTDGRLASGVTALYEDREGNLWAGGMGSLWRWKPGPPKLYTLADPGQPMYALIGSDDGGILICRRNGVAKLKDGKIRAYPLAGGPEFKPARLLRDRHGSLWVGAVVDKGLLHVHDGRTDLFTPTDGLSGGAVTALIEDFEGNIWVATLDGLDRFRDFAIPSISLQQSVSSQGVSSILAARDGSVWLGTSNGFDRWNAGRMTVYRRRSMRTVGGGIPSAQSAATLREIIDPGLPEDTANALFEDQGGELWVGTFNGVAVYRSGRFFHVESVPPGFVYSITGDPAGNVWISHQDALFRFAHSRIVQRVPWNKLGRREPATAVIHDPVQGGLWLGFRDGGVAFLDNDQLRASYSGPEGLGGGMIGSFYMDGPRTLWVGTEGGLSRIKDGRVLTLTSKNGLPCNMVHWMRDDKAQGVWLYLACGLVRIPRSELDAWVSDPKRNIGMTHFDTSDGVRGRGAYPGSDPVVAKTADGKLWFMQPDGVGVIDPRNLAWNALPPPVHIESIEADGKTYNLRPGARLPPGVRDLSIEFTALSLVAPDKMHFKYLLEHQDVGWKEVINQRRVQYTNLPPRNYVFRVMASNNSGVWNETGDTLEFSIDPAYYQTNWFRAALAAAFLVAMWGLYRLRLLQISREFNAQLEVRVDERLRVARELHDTLLQSFQGMMPFLQAARNKFAKGGDGLETLDQALGLGAQAIAEGRKAIQGMRSSTTITNDLARAIHAVGDELKSEGSAEFRVLVEGSSRNLHPILRDEVYGIAREAIRNAFHHAEAKAIEVEIAYRDDLRVRIRDDGKGIDPEIAKEGRSGHYGIPGMRERAGRIGGKLTVWSAPGAGTEIELRVPGSKAFGKSSTRSLAALFRCGNGKGESAVAGDRHGE